MFGGESKEQIGFVEMRRDVVQHKQLAVTGLRREEARAQQINGGGCGPVVRLLVCYARAWRSVPHSREIGI